MSITVCCVLKAGGSYNAMDVRRLYMSVACNLKYEEFVCLTDKVDAVTALPDAPDYRVRAITLAHAWPATWSKMEIWRPDVFAEGTRVLYFDLNTVIVGNLEDIADQAAPWIVVGDFYRRPPGRRRIALDSSIMLWTANDQDAIYTKFARTPQKIMSYFRGDQWIECQNPNADLWELLVPGQVLSFNKDSKKGLPSNARVVVLRGGGNWEYTNGN